MHLFAECLAGIWAQDMPELISDDEDDNAPIQTFQTDQEWRQAISSFRGALTVCFWCYLLVHEALRLFGLLTTCAQAVWHHCYAVDLD